MQSKTSFFNRGIMDKNLRRVMAISIIYFIIELIIVPVQYMIYISPKGGWGDEYSNAYYMYECCSIGDMNGILPCIMVVSSMIAIFSYMFNKRDTYMIHAFPVSRKALFTSGVVSSLIATISPLILVAAISNVIAVTTGTPESVSAIWYYAFTGISATVFFTGLLVLCMMFSGQLITALVFFGILNFVVLGMDFTFKLASTVLNFGLSNALNNIEINGFTPIAFLGSCGVACEIKWDNSYSKIVDILVYYNEPKTLIAYLVVGIVFIIAAYYVYKYKKLETVHDFISFEPIKPVFSIGMSFFCSLALAVFFEQIFDSTIVQSFNVGCTIIIVLSLVIGVIIYFFIQMLIEKTSRVFTKKIITQCVVYCLCSLVVILGIKLDVAGIEKKVPKADEIEWAAIQGNYVYLFENPNEIESVLGFHKDIISNKKTIVNMSYDESCDGESMIIKYKLKNGKYILRSYYLDYSGEIKNDDYNKLTDNIALLLNDPKTIKEHVIGSYYDEAEVTDVCFSEIEYDKEYDSYNTEYVYPEFASADEKLEKLNKIYAAILLDIEDGALCQYPTDSDNNYYNDFSITLKTEKKYLSDENKFYNWGDYAENVHDFYFNLNPNCVNTIAALKDAGYLTKDSRLVTYKTIEGAR